MTGFNDNFVQIWLRYRWLNFIIFTSCIFFFWWVSISALQNQSRFKTFSLISLNFSAIAVIIDDITILFSSFAPEWTCGLIIDRIDCQCWIAKMNNQNAIEQFLRWHCSVWYKRWYQWVKPIGSFNFYNDLATMALIWQQRQRQQKQKHITYFYSHDYKNKIQRKKKHRPKRISNQYELYIEANDYAQCDVWIIRELWTRSIAQSTTNSFVFFLFPLSLSLFPCLSTFFLIHEFIHNFVCFLKALFCLHDIAKLIT